MLLVPRRAHVTAAPREAGGDDSRGSATSPRRHRGSGALSQRLLALGLIGAGLVALSEFLATFHVVAITAEVARTTGHEQHSWAFLLIAILAAVMAWGAANGASRPAMFALLVLGTVVVAVALLNDLPDATKTGVVGSRFADAEASPQIGFWVELVGGLVLAGTALGHLVLGREASE